MNKRYLRITAFTVIAIVLSIFVILIGQSNGFASASKNDNNIEKRFENDSVLITLTEEATRQFLTYTPESFPEVNCIHVEDLTQYTAEYVKDKIQGNYTEKSMLIDVEQFRRIMRLELKKKTKENVLHAIEVLQQREDILYAAPNYIYSIASTTPDDPYYVAGWQWGLSGRIGKHIRSRWDLYAI